MDYVSEYIKNITDRIVAKTNNALVDWTQTEHVLALESILAEDGVPFHIINELILQLQKPTEQLIKEKEKEEKDLSPEEKKERKKQAEDDNIEYSGGGWVSKNNSEERYKWNGHKFIKTEEPGSSDEEQDKEQEKYKNINGKHDGKPDGTDPQATDGRPDREPEKEPKEVIIKGKTKTLKPGEPTSDKIWSEDLAISDDNFVKNMQKAGVKIKTPAFSINTNEFQANVPTKYRKLLERLMSVEPSKATGAISAFTGESAGAGTINSQAGEVLTMIAVAFKPREDWPKFTGQLKEYIKKTSPKGTKGDKGSIVKLDWIDAATKSAESIERIIADKYGEGAKVMTAVWDTEKDFNLIGGTDYKKNKGYSTDIYLKVRNSEGDEELLEVSLKKDTETFLLNSTISQVYGESHDLTKTANDYRHETNNGIVKAIQSNIFTKDELAKNPKLAERIQNISQNYKNNLPQSYADTYAVYKAINAKAEQGDESAKTFMEDDKKQYTETRTKIISSMVDGKEAKQATLKMIEDKLPLSSVADDEEVIVLGDIYIDGQTLKKILGTDDISTLRKHIVPVMYPAKGNTPATPMLVYKADDTNKKPIPIATLKARQKPRGGGGFLFDVKLEKSFIKRIKSIRDQKGSE